MLIVSGGVTAWSREAVPLDKAAAEDRCGDDVARDCVALAPPLERDGLVGAELPSALIRYDWALARRPLDALFDVLMFSPLTFGTPGDVEPWRPRKPELVTGEDAVLPA